MTPRRREFLAMLACWMLLAIIAGIVIRPRLAYDMGWGAINAIAITGRALPRAPATLHIVDVNGAGLGPRIGTEAPPPAR